jgi:GntR family transcriptional regulator
VLSRERGRGTVVTGPSNRQQGALWSLYDAVEQAGYVQASDVRSLHRTRNAQVAARLGLPPGSWLVHIARTRRLDDVPIALDDAWLPSEIASPILKADFSHTALYNELAQRCGIVMDGGEETVTAVVPTADERAFLQMPSRSAALLLERRSCAGGRFVEWRRTIVAGDRFSLRTEWDPTLNRRLSLRGELVSDESPR